MQLAYSRMAPITLRIKEFRLARGWSQAHLSRVSGVPQPTISRLEREQEATRPRSVDFAVLEQLSRAFALHPRELIGMETGEGTPPRRRTKQKGGR